MSTVLARPLPLALSAAWRRPLAVLALLVAALPLLYPATWAAMVGIWMRSDTFAHAFLVPPIALWLAWRRREWLAAVQPRAAAAPLLALALAAALWLPGDMVGLSSLTQLMVTAMLVAIVVAVLGPSVARELAFPLAFLFFMVPFGEALTPLFMDWTADFTVAALRASGVPVYREGLNFVIPSGSWSVVEACSGVRYLIASFMVGTLFAYLNFSSLRRRLLFAAIALVVPVVANWLRAYLIVMLGHLSDNKLAAGVDHLIYGWLFFGVIVLAMFMIGARWAEPASAGPPPQARPPAGAGAGPLVAVALASLALLALPPALRWQQRAQEQAVLPALALQLPDLPGTTAAPDGAAAFEPVFANPSAVVRRSYALPDGVVQVHVAYYRQQGFGRKLVGTENALVPSQDSPWLRTGTGTAVDAAGQQWRSAELRNGGAGGSSARARLDVRQLYWVGGRFTTSDTQAVALGLWHRLLGRGDDAAMITVFTEGAVPAQTAARLDPFTGRHLAAIAAGLDAAMTAGRRADASSRTPTATPSTTP